MTKNFVFRPLPGTRVESSEQLFERVVEMSTELLLDEHIEDFNPMVGSRWCDQGGPAVVMPIHGPPGWHFHREGILRRHGLACVPYP